MAAMDIILNESVVGKCLNYKPLDQAHKIISTALTGTVYAQSTGEAIKTYEMYVYCATATNRGLIDAASNNCEEVTFILRDGETEVTGFIQDETIDWREWKDGHGVGHFTLVKE